MAKTMLSNLTTIAQNTSSSRIQMIDINELYESPDNFFLMERIDELADAILGQGGVKDNLIVTPRKEGGYEIISGHRRRAAVQFLLDHGGSISPLLPCLVQRYPDDDSRIMDMILMNVSARQLSDQELWQSYERIDQILQDQKSAIGRRFGRVREKLADMLGISSSQVSKLQHIKSSAEPEVQEAVADGTLSINTANEIAKLKPEMQQELMQDDAVTPKKIREAAKKKVDTPVNEQIDKITEPDRSTKVDTPVTLPAAAKDMLHYAMKPQAERDRIFESGCFNDIALGYLTLTLKEMDMDENAIRNAQKIMNELFESSTAADARTAYQES